MTTKNNFIFNQKKPWDDNSNTIWLASTISLQRNIEKFKFPGKLNAESKSQIVSLISKHLLKISGLTDPILIKAEDIGPLEKEFLAEHLLTSQNYNQTNVGEGFIVDSTGEFTALLNIQDHIRLQLIDCKGELENTWSRLVKIESNLGKHLNYSFLPTYGFLTADPYTCGTALIGSIYLQLPGLIHTGKIDEILDKYQDEAISISGIQGSPTEIIGDVLLIQNNYTLGFTEENIISLLRSFTTKLIVEEKSARTKIKKESNIEVKDKISRAFGILIHSYQLEAVEALNALSLLKLGLDLGWITGIDNQKINEIFFNCRRAHLLSQIQDNVTQEEVPHKRSETLHKALQSIQLTV